MDAEADAQARVRDLVKELRDARGLSYKELAAQLSVLGVTIDDRVLANRINRGTFSAGFLVLLLQVLGATSMAVTKKPARLRAALRTDDAPPRSS